MPKGLPIPLSSLVNLNAEYHHYFTGQRDNLHVCCLKYSYSMRLQGPQIWSNIPFNFYALPSICPIIKVNSKATICHCIASLPSFDYLVAFKFTYITTFFLSYNIPFLKDVYTTEQKWQGSDKNWNGSNSFCKETVYIRSATGPMADQTRTDKSSLFLCRNYWNRSSFCRIRAIFSLSCKCPFIISCYLASMPAIIIN